MRTRAGIILIENDKVALIERHRAGLDYYVFPGGGVDEGETPEQAAVREAFEELGVEVAIRQKRQSFILITARRSIFWWKGSVGSLGQAQARNSPIQIPRSRAGYLHPDLDANRGIAAP
jgi:8-oxo-dGTP pyrophosphatase MutT (NUDIX family)